MLRTITATEANRNFSEVARQIKDGDSFIVTSHGEPIIRMERVDKEMLRREVARRELLERLDRQEGVKIVSWSRDELYDDDDE